MTGGEITIMKRSLVVSISAAVIAIVIAAVVAAATGSGLTQSNNTGSSPQQQSDVKQVDSLQSAFEKLSSPIKVTSASAEGPAYVPNVAIDPNKGTMYVAFIEQQANGTSNLYVKRSDDGGKTFASPVRVNDKPGDVFFDGRVPPSIKVGAKGEVYVLWVKGVPAPKLFMTVMRQPTFAVSTDGAKTFSPAVVIAENEPPADRSFYGLDASKDGKIYVGWLNFPVKKLDNGTIVSDDSAINTVRFTRSLDGGHTFEPSIAVDKDPCECCNVNLLAHGDNDVFISWRKKFEVPSDQVPNSSAISEHSATAMGNGSSGGNMSMTMMKMDKKTNNNGMTTVRDIVVARSIDGGKSFSEPNKVSNDNFAYDSCVHVGAPMAMDSKGRLHIVWYTGKEGSPGIYYAVSEDNGKTFGKPIPILTGDWVPPSRAQLVVDSKDNAWIAWEDTSGLSANSVHWKYEDTRALIFTAMITPDGQVFKASKPINPDDGKSPVIANGRDNLSIVWAGIDNEIRCSTMKMPV